MFHTAAGMPRVSGVEHDGERIAAEACAREYVDGAITALHVRLLSRLPERLRRFAVHRRHIEPRIAELRFFEPGQLVSGFGATMPELQRCERLTNQRTEHEGQAEWAQMYHGRLRRTLLMLPLLSSTIVIAIETLLLEQFS
jgi:hypothetical protein